MLQVKKLLCATDFSEPSYRALERAAELAQHFDAELLVVHVVAPVPTMTAPPGPMAFDVASYQQHLTEGAESSLHDVLRERVPDDVTVRPVVRLGGAAQEVLQLAEKEGVELIVTATGGQSGWRRFVFGSVAERMIRSAHCPVLVLPAQEA